jgi:hypothetical protein
MNPNAEREGARTRRLRTQSITAVAHHPRSSETLQEDLFLLPKPLEAYVGSEDDGAGAGEFPQSVTFAGSGRWLCV